LAGVEISDEAGTAERASRTVDNRLDAADATDEYRTAIGRIVDAGEDPLEDLLVDAICGAHRNCTQLYLRPVVHNIRGSEF
jgi:hypothetical protein